MNEKDFFSFVCDQYRSTFELSNALYPRAGVILTAQVVLGGAALSLGRHDLIGRLFERVDIFSYYVFAGIALTCIGFAVTQLILAVLPRDYPKVVNLALPGQYRFEPSLSASPRFPF